MNKQELIKYCESLKGDLNKFINGVDVDNIIAEIEQLDEPQPLKLKDIISRMKQLFPLSRSEWIDEILHEFGEEFGSKKYRDGYEQGKSEGAWVGEQLKDADKIRRELNRPVVPQYIAEWIEYCKFTNVNLQNALLVGDVYFYNYANQKDFSKLKEFLETDNNQETFARAWLDGYTVEKEKRYKVTLSNGQPLVKPFNRPNIYFSQNILDLNYNATKKELEEADFGWVFDCEGIEIEEVE